jgi:endogenous inhibitor of DNA gyrase (YacG/DUF329 family)
MSADDNSRAQRKREPACPNCGKPPDPRYQPFCSKRCADVDLHRWLTGGYVIPGQQRGSETEGGDEEDG